MRIGSMLDTLELIIWSHFVIVLGRIGLNNTSPA